MLYCQGRGEHHRTGSLGLGIQFPLLGGAALKGMGAPPGGYMYVCGVPVNLSVEEGVAGARRQSMNWYGSLGPLLICRAA